MNLLLSAKRWGTPLPKSIVSLRGRKRHKVVAIALANKLARIAWAVVTKKEDFCPGKFASTAA
jgi:hypothetical protein